MIKEFWFLLQKEAVLEWRSRYAVGGVVLYVVSTVFVVFMASVKVAPNVWNTLFWIITLFGSANALVKSFVPESAARELYYYTLADPVAVIFSKIVYNILLLFAINLATYFFMTVFVGNPVKDTWMFFGILALGSASLAISFTFVSALAVKARNSATLMAILGFPVIIPVLITTVKISANALRLFQDTAIGKDVLILISIDAIMISLSFILFPYLWRD